MKDTTPNTQKQPVDNAELIQRVSALESKLDAIGAILAPTDAYTLDPQTVARLDTLATARGLSVPAMLDTLIASAERELTAMDRPDVKLSTAERKAKQIAPGYLTVKEAASVLGVTTRSVFKYIDREDLDSMKVNGRVLVSADSVQRLRK